MRDMEYCAKCELNNENTYVPSEGEPTSPIWFVGEAPGATEVFRQCPFIGRSGLNGRNWFRIAASRMDSELEVKRGYMFITNTVWCRPPNNKTPDSTLYNHCGQKYLLELYKQYTPPIVILVGKTAARFFLGTDEKTLILRYVPLKIGDTTFIHIHHPSYICRNGHMADEYVNSLMRVVAIIQAVKS